MLVWDFFVLLDMSFVKWFEVVGESYYKYNVDLIGCWFVE